MKKDYSIWRRSQKLVPVNVEVISDAIAFLKKSSWDFDMTWWFSRKRTDDEHCKTSCCFAGAVCLVSGLRPVFELTHESSRVTDGGWSINVQKAAEKLIGGNPEDVQKLFSVDTWPFDLHFAYNKAKSAVNRVSVLEEVVRRWLLDKGLQLTPKVEDLPCFSEER